MSKFLLVPYILRHLQSGQEFRLGRYRMFIYSEDNGSSLGVRQDGTGLTPESVNATEGGVKLLLQWIYDQEANETTTTTTA